MGSESCPRPTADLSSDIFVPRGGAEAAKRDPAGFIRRTVRALSGCVSALSVLDSNSFRWCFCMGVRGAFFALFNVSRSGQSNATLDFEAAAQNGTTIRMIPLKVRCVRRMLSAPFSGASPLFSGRVVPKTRITSCQAQNP